MGLGVQKSRPSLNLGVIDTLDVHPQKCGVWLRRWENQRMLSSMKLEYLVTQYCIIAWLVFYRASACNAMHGIAVENLSVCLSDRRMYCDKTK